MDNCEQAQGCQPSDPLESSAMELLPDELLLLVMKHLDVRDLISCRLVCKRLAGLAVDPDVWRHRDLHDSNPRACAVLRVAPCLNSLYIGRMARCHRRQLSRTKCAAARLSFELGFERYCPAVGFEEVIRNQKALGRLKGLSVNGGLEMGMEGVAAAKLLDISMSISGLEELSITAPWGFMSRMPIRRSVSSASLKALKLRWSRKLGNSQYDPMKFYEFLLAEHAGTLERVELKNLSVVMSAPAALMGSMPNLRELRCTPLTEMKALAASTSLRKLKLTVTEGAVGPETREFLRRANQLRDVTLKYSSRDEVWGWKSNTAGVALVLDLASSGRSSVETLRIFNKERYLPQVQPLLRALPMLTCLRHLHVEVAPDELLVAITPITAPALQSLVTRKSNWGCLHAWLHRAEVKKLLSENPALHVEMHLEENSCDFYACARCHCDLVLQEEAVFFTHDPEDKCPSPEMHKQSHCSHIADVSNLKTVTMPRAAWRGWSDESN